MCCSRGCFSGKTQRGCVSARARSESPVAKQVQAHLASVCCCVTVLNHCLLATRPSSSSSSSSTRPSFKVRVLLLPLSGEPFPCTLISHPHPHPHPALPFVPATTMCSGCSSGCGGKCETPAPRVSSRGRTHGPLVAEVRVYACVCVCYSTMIDCIVRVEHIRRTFPKTRRHIDTTSVLLVIAGGYFAHGVYILAAAVEWRMGRRSVTKHSTSLPINMHASHRR